MKLNFTPGTASLTAFTVFYSTYYWHYIRAQVSEPIQLLLLLVFIYFFLISLNKRTLRFCKVDFLASCSLIILILTKSTYALLIPAIVLCLIFAHRKLIPKTYAYVSTMLLAISIKLILNDYQYEGFLNTGYTQFFGSEKNMFISNPFPGWLKLLTSNKASIFVHFPIIVFSLLGFKNFYLKNQVFSIFCISFFASYFFLIGFHIDVMGEWCYGSRLLMVPKIIFAFFFAQKLSDLKLNKNGGLSIAFLMICIFSLSSSLHWNVIKYDFFLTYRLEQLYRPLMNKQMNHLFSSSPNGMLNYKIANSLKYNPKEFLSILGLSDDINPNLEEELTTKTKEHLRPNFYFTR